MADNLKQAAEKIKAQRKARKTTSTGAKKTTSTARKTTSTGTKKTTSTAKRTTTASKKTTGITPTVAKSASTPIDLLPGVVSLTPDEIKGMMPQFNSADYTITDPLHPPATLPQVSEQEFDVGMSRYKGAIRALKLTGESFNLTGERFNVETKKARSYSAGLEAGIEFEKVKSKHYKYLTQVEETKQNQSNYNLAVKRTTHVEQVNQYSEDELDQTLEKSRLRAEQAKLQVESSQNKLNELRQQLTGGN